MQRLKFRRSIVALALLFVSSACGTGGSNEDTADAGQSDSSDQPELNNPNGNSVCTSPSGEVTVNYFMRGQSYFPLVGTSTKWDSTIRVVTLGPEQNGSDSQVYLTLGLGEPYRVDGLTACFAKIESAVMASSAKRSGTAAEIQAKTYELDPEFECYADYFLQGTSTGTLPILYLNKSYIVSGQFCIGMREVIVDGLNFSYGETLEVHGKFTAEEV